MKLPAGVHVCAAALGAMLVVADASGQDLCAELESIINAAPDRFRSLQGRRDPDSPNFHFAARTLPNATECSVYHSGDGLDSYDCEWEYDDGSKLNQAYESFAASVGACLKPMRTRNRTGGRVIKGTMYIISDDGAYSVDVTVEQKRTSRGRELLVLSVNRNDKV